MGKKTKQQKGTGILAPHTSSATTNHQKPTDQPTPTPNLQANTRTRTKKRGGKGRRPLTRRICRKKHVSTAADSVHHRRDQPSLSRLAALHLRQRIVGVGYEHARTSQGAQSRRPEMPSHNSSSRQRGGVGARRRGGLGWWWGRWGAKILLSWLF